MLKATFGIILSFVLLDVGCGKSMDSGSSSASGTITSTGVGGSLARFTIAFNHLYVVDNNTLKVYDVTDPVNGVFKKSIIIGGGIETIFPYQDKLFIGSTTGMFIYSIATPANPVFLSNARHVRSCDPVVASGNFSYVTLRGGTPCGPAQDVLNVYNVSNVTSPVLTSSLALPTPHGLGIQDNTVYVCLEKNGLSVVDVSNPSAPIEKKRITDADWFYDVIPVSNLLICYTNKGIALYDIQNRLNPSLISKVAN
ncbi:MAG TPA: hypothetical protein VF622_07330 [Segetibacter sp.]|jgi:hypothetical protein